MTVFKILKMTDGTTVYGKELSCVSAKLSIFDKPRCVSIEKTLGSPDNVIFYPYIKRGIDKVYFTNSTIMAKTNMTEEIEKEYIKATTIVQDERE